MSEPANNNKTRAKVFFARAKEIADRGNFDYAIDMYLEGLRLEPDNLEEGHIPLRKLALLRQTQGGKKPGIKDRLKLMHSKDPLEQMLWAEYLLAKDPDHLPYAQTMLKAAVEAGCTQTVQWLADLLFQANANSEHPSVNIYIQLKDAYAAIGRYDKAVAACYQAYKLKPQDGELADEYKRLSAELALSRGKYDTQGDFHKAIKDREQQELLHAEEGVVKSDLYRNSLIEAARTELAENPDSTTAILHLANVLAETEEEKDENEALELLEQAYNRKKDPAIKKRHGEILITQLKRKLRHLKSAPQPDNKAIEELTNKLHQITLEHWRFCVEHYPTDLAAKYEYGSALLENNRYDEAIPLFQQSQKDPRRRISSMNKLGICFYKKGWLDDAIDIFTQAINAHQIKDDAIGKELCYNLGLCYEQKGQIEKALEIYRKIAQVDFSYKDVSSRVEHLRGQAGNSQD